MNYLVCNELRCSDVHLYDVVTSITMMQRRPPSRLDNGWRYTPTGRDWARPVSTSLWSNTVEGWSAP